MAFEFLSFYKFQYFHSNRNSTLSKNHFMFCDPNGVSSFHCPLLFVTFSSFVVDSHCPLLFVTFSSFVVDSHCPLLFVTFSSFVVDSHCPLPIVTQCCNYVVDVDPKGEKPSWWKCHNCDWIFVTYCKSSHPENANVQKKELQFHTNPHYFGEGFVP